MMYLDEIVPDYSVRNEILSLLPVIEGEPEMTDFDSAFLCGVLNRYRPKKVVEVGIAGGGTTAIITKCLCDQDRPFEHYSIDLNEKFYRDSTYDSGFLGQKADCILQEKHSYKHKYLFNNVACSFAQDIGESIDCLIIDTVHSCPGEILDFITLLPFLQNGCVVILHDLVYNHFTRERGKRGFSNTILFASVSGEKYINMDDSVKTGIPNIGFFVVDDETRKNISDMFFSLLVTWTYMPDERQLNEYRRAIKKYYGDDLLQIYDSAVELNSADLIVYGRKYEFPFQWLPYNSRIVLYGAGQVGKEFAIELKKKRDFKLIKWVDRDYENIGVPWVESVGSLNDIDDEQYDYVVIAVERKEMADEIKNNLESMGIKPDKIFWRNPLIL